MLLFHVPVGYHTPPLQVVPTIRADAPLYEVAVKWVPIVLVLDDRATCPRPAGSAVMECGVGGSLCPDAKQTSGCVTNTPSSTPVTAITQCFSVSNGSLAATACPPRASPLAMTTATAAIR